MTRPGGRRTTTLVGLAVAGLLAACGSSDDPAAETSQTAVAPTTTASSPSAEAARIEEREDGCGVTLAEVQALLPAGSGVTENATPDPRRCNFTWDDGGPRRIDVAIAPGGAASFDVPAGFEPVDGYGEQAYTSTGPGRVSAVALVGRELHAADVSADGSRDDFTDLCLRLLELTLD